MSLRNPKVLYENIFKHKHNKVIGVAYNNISHANESNLKSLPSKPQYFTKGVNSILESGSVMYLNSRHEIDHEVELGVIISKTCANVKKEDVMDYIEGYFLGIDFTDRTMANVNKK